MSTPPLRRRELAILAVGVVISSLSWLAMSPWNFYGFMIGAPLGRDFVNFWMAPRLVFSGEGAMLVDPAAYRALIRTLFDLPCTPTLIFVYPPHALLLFAPFSALPFLPGVLLWTTANLAGLAMATRLLLRGSPAWVPVLAVCLSPPAVAMMMYGHFGGLLALATTVTLLEARRRPILAGVCLALLSMKPQFACALGLMLLLTGCWRCLVAGAVATFALVLCSVGVFGIEVWPRFVSITMPMQSAFITAFDAKMIETSVTAYFAARYSGVPAGAAWAIQGVVSAACLAFGVAALKRDMREPGALAIVILGALVMQPYVSHYDLAIAAPALTLLILGRVPSASPITVAVWLLVPMAGILIIFEWPILAILVPCAFVAQALRFLRPPGIALPRRPALDAAA